MYNLCFYQLCYTNPKADFPFEKTFKVDKLPRKTDQGEKEIERQRESEREREKEGGRERSIALLG